jgi:hypothetical protein
VAACRAQSSTFWPTFERDIVPEHIPSIRVLLCAASASAQVFYMQQRRPTANHATSMAIVNRRLDEIHKTRE